MYNVNEEYKVNECFERYVNKYATAYHMTPVEAMNHELVVQVGEAYYNKRIENSKVG